MIHCTIGLMAHNEERNIVPALCALLDQKLDGCEIDEIIVIASGCTDRTVELARHVAADDARIVVDAEPVRSGKASAINRLIRRARGEVIVVCGADTLPDEVAISRLVAPFRDATVGMTGAQVVPVDRPDTVLGRVSHMMWRLHHQMALRRPKLGEMVAFRNVVDGIPAEASTDEVALEAAVSARGYRLVYAPEALVFNRGPQTLHDFLMQRRRIYAGHLDVVEHDGYEASSMSLWRTLPLAWSLIATEPRLAPWVPVVALLECYGRFLGARDARSGGEQGNGGIWPMARTTKQVHPVHRPLAVLVLECDPGHPWTQLRRHRFRRLARARHAMLWWDDADHRVVFVVMPDGDVDAADLARALCDDLEQGLYGDGTVCGRRIVRFRRLPVATDTTVRAPRPLVASAPRR